MGATKMCSEDNACHRPGTATCVNMWRKRRCECRDGYTNTAEADDCSTDVDECAVAAEAGENLCLHDGKCMNTQGDFECLCTMGWAGKTCDADFDECSAALCPAGTVCKID